MKMKPTTILTAVVSGLSLLFVVSCGGDNNNHETPGDPAAGSGDNTESLAPFLVENAHSDVKQISEVFANPTPGTKVIVGGEIMGSKEPFVENRAMLVLGDPTKITPCNRRPDDLCETPWDVCCDVPETIKKSIATIQFLDQDGKLIQTGLKGYQGIKELTYLTVAGTIAEGSNAENLLITASEIHVADESPYKDAAPVSGHGHEHEEEDAG